MREAFKTPGRKPEEKRIIERRRQRWNVNIPLNLFSKIRA
jgi:hypothetical protein